MKPSDKIILTYLRKCDCQNVPDAEWAQIEDAVEKAGDIRNVTGYASTVLFDAIKKARFSSRSEAGRYAANMRWKGQGERTGLQTGKRDRGKRDRLKAMSDIESNQAQIKRLYEQQSRMGIGEEKSIEQIQNVIDRLEQLDRNLRSKNELNGDRTRSQPSEADIAGMSQRNYEQDELRAFIDENEGLLEVMQDLGESESKIAEQKNIISRAKQDLESGRANNSSEAEIKQAFIDAQKERLANMGRGTSQVAYVALEAGIKQLEAELASGDTSEARNRPGQFFDDRPGSKGPKYIGRRPAKEVAVDIRRDLKSAVENGELPKGLKFSVVTDTRGTNTIRVRVKGVPNPRVRDDLGRDVTSPEAKAIYDKVDRITNAYNRNNSDAQTDYFDTDYYGFVNIDN